MEIPHIPSRSGFECRAAGPRVPLPPLVRAGMAGNCWASCVMAPLRTERSDWCPLWGQMPSFTKMSQAVLAFSLLLFLSYIFLLFLLFWRIYSLSVYTVWSYFTLTSFSFIVSAIPRLFFIFSFSMIIATNLLFALWRKFQGADFFFRNISAHCHCLSLSLFTPKI